MLVDSHCHLHLLPPQFNLDTVIDDAHKNDVEHLLCVAVELNDVPKLYELADKYNEVSISVGVHPTATNSDCNLSNLERLANHPKCIAIGETGLDFYRLDAINSKEQQCQRFATHIQAAISTNKPLIIHTRQAAQATLQIMALENAAAVGGVMHCFTENLEVAYQALDLNFYISFSGIITFKNAAALRLVAQQIPLDRILIETDAPYLAPAPYRGQTNYPALVKQVALALSALRDLDYQEIAQITTENFYRCFRLCNSRK